MREISKYKYMLVNSPVEYEPIEIVTKLKERGSINEFRLSYYQNIS